MNRFLLVAVFLAGLLAVAWVGSGYVGHQALGLAATALIAACYLVGGLELRRFHLATASLARAVDGLAEPPATLAAWLQPIHPSLRAAVRRRVEGERGGLPGPALAPYLSGLLVLLGMLGTFIGMVATLRGTGIALDSATDLSAIRASLSAPVKGLGLAFGASVAGVAASAALGLLAALLRRERLQVGQRLDARVAGELRAFSRAQQREAGFELLRRQADAMPALVQGLQALMARIEQQTGALHERLQAGQAQFHDQAEAAYLQLAESVGRSLQTSLSEGARAAQAAIQPAVQSTLDGITRETAGLHQALTQRVQQQLEAVSGGLEATGRGVAHSWQQALAEHQRTSEALARQLQAHLQGTAEVFEQRSAALVEGVSIQLQRTLAEAASRFERHGAALAQSVDEAQLRLQAQLAARDEQRLAGWTQQLTAQADRLAQQWQQAGTQAAARQQAAGETLAQGARTLAAQTEAQVVRTLAEIDRLVQAAGEAPRAAAEVVAELRARLADSTARDNALLEERSRVLATMDTLLNAVNRASGEQRAAIDALVSRSAELLEQAGRQFEAQAGAHAGELARSAAQVGAGAVEVASLGEAFGAATQQFSDTSERLAAQLARIEEALGRSLARSDEQLAYYVAQAREVIDLSLGAQQQIVQELQHATARAAVAAVPAPEAA